MSRKFQAHFVDPKGALMQDQYGYALVVVKAGAPTDSIAGFQKGCLYFRTDGTYGTNAVLYVNRGSVTSTTWLPLV